MKNPKENEAFEETEVLGGVNVDINSQSDLFNDGLLDNNHEDEAFGISPDIFNRHDGMEEIEFLES